MKKHLFFLAALYIVASLDPVISQKLISNTSVTGVCYAGNKTNRIYIPPPDQFFKKSGKGGATVTVNHTGFPKNALVPVEYAASILETILPPGTNIIITASWERITTAGVLANSSITDYAGGWTIDAQNPLAVYPIALAEKIAGENLNDTLGDITLRVNSSVNWYFGTDGNTSPSKFDLVTVVLHELCHGLGYFDSMNTDNTIGWYGIEIRFGIGNGIDTLPLIYDTYIENGTGNRLTDTLVFKNFSADLRSEITGGDLYFNGPLLKTYTSGSRAPVYSPPDFDPGSSISHLDEDKTLVPNTLMTPYIDMGEAIHNPGKYTLSILGDLGWINTRIIHKASHDTEDHLNELLLSVRIQSDTLYNHEKVGAVFSFNNFASSDTIFMTSHGFTDKFDCTISLQSYNTEVQYYFFTEDCFMRVYRSPSLSDTLRYSVYIGTDTVSPVISHTPLTSFLEKIDTIKFNATATDNLGIDTVFAEYKLNEGQSQFIGLKAGKENSYSAELIARSLLLNGGDSIQYRIIAADSAKLPNSSVVPDSGYFTIHIEGLMATLESYSTDFSGDAADDFFNKGFDIFKPSGFSRYGLNSRHPYESPEDNDKTIEYTSILRHPLKFNESGILISFNEIVLVEPGETGSIFGSEKFFDYVIVEGSKDFGNKWFRLADGYDSRLLKIWETAYNNSSDGMNSTAVGNESMLNKHTIYYHPSDNVSAGDTLILRFRLYSDPFANGWGWVIEDLKINPLVDAVEEVHSDGSVIIFPNPGRGLLRISITQGDTDRGKSIRYNIFNTSGTCIKSDYLTREMENVIDISDHPTGIYIIVLSGDQWIKTIKYSLIK
jgi:hypothetical protein